MTTSANRPLTISSALEMGEIIRDGRTAAGLTQAELARAAQVGRQWLVSVEAGGRASAPLDMVLRVLACLKIRLVLAPPGLELDAEWGERQHEVGSNLARVEDHQDEGADLDDLLARLAGPR